MFTGPSMASQDPFDRRFGRDDQVTGDQHLIADRFGATVGERMRLQPVPHLENPRDQQRWRRRRRAMRRTRPTRQTRIPVLVITGQPLVQPLP